MLLTSLNALTSDLLCWTVLSLHDVTCVHLHCVTSDTDIVTNTGLHITLLDRLGGACVWSGVRLSSSVKQSLRLQMSFPLLLRRS